jgi:predicted nucleic acid-binding protein
LEKARRGNRLTALVDTNVLIRHLTGDPPELARRATRLLKSGRPLILTDLVVAECVYVLSSFYEIDDATIAVLMQSAFAVPSIEVPGERVLLRALELFESMSLHFAEAYLVANAESNGAGAVASFDQAIDRVKTVRRITS